jgi:hypothetical protein
MTLRVNAPTQPVFDRLLNSSFSISLVVFMLTFLLNSLFLPAYDEACTLYP